jgi:hypothetical protein
MTEPTPQEAEPPSSEACWALLERIAASVQLHRAPRLREFLLYVGRRSLKDGCGQIHELEIGVEVFGRPDTYDTGVDNIVRANATELRKRIEAYFESEGLHETLIMEIPRGGYVPVFRYRPAEVHSAPVSAGASASESLEEVPLARPAPGRRRWMLPALIVAVIASIVLAVCCLTLWLQNQAMHRSFYAWQYEPSVAAFWSEVLGASPDTDIVMSDAFFKLAQDLSKKSYTLDDYLSRSYVRQLILQAKSPETREVLGKVSAWSSGNSNHLSLARRILALDPLGKSIRLYYARDYTPNLIKRNNVILLGSRVTNPWDSLFDNRLNFTVELESDQSSAIINRAPAAGEQKIYNRTDSVGYCVVAYLPNPNSKGKVLLIEGTSVEATEAGGDFLLSEDQLSSFQRMLHVSKLPYFEMLLKTSQVKGTPLTAKIEVYRTYPDQH